jgi:hypothetical protein
MNKMMRLVLVLCLFLANAVASQADATNYTLWINGRVAGGAVGAVGNYDDFSYWGPARFNAGVNKKAVNWDGYNSIASQNGKVRDALDCFCTGSNWCYIATYSAGDPMMGYALASYGGSTRQVKNATPNGAGVCGSAGGATQTGWNIRWVRAAAGAAGGTELSDTGRWTTGEPLVHDLKTTTVRAMYNHNDTRGVWFYMYAGSKGTLYSFVLPGQDDEVVAYHSSGAVSGTNGAAYCNPRDRWCNDLTLGSQVNEGGWPKWNNHYLSFRDDTEYFTHYLNGNWEGVTAVMRAAMEANAL